MSRIEFSRYKPGGDASVLTGSKRDNGATAATGASAAITGSAGAAT